MTAPINVTGEELTTVISPDPTCPGGNIIYKMFFTVDANTTVSLEDVNGVQLSGFFDMPEFSSLNWDNDGSPLSTNGLCIRQTNSANIGGIVLFSRS
jgi:hypothetical protein